jgi:hypothetical protein
MLPGRVPDEKVNDQIHFMPKPATAALESMLCSDRDSFSLIEQTVKIDDEVYVVAERVRLLGFCDDRFSFPVVGRFEEEDEEVGVSTVPRGSGGVSLGYPIEKAFQMPSRVLIHESRPPGVSMHRVVSNRMETFGTEITTADMRAQRPHLVRSLALEGCIDSMDTTDNLGG